MDSARWKAFVHTDDKNEIKTELHTYYFQTQEKPDCDTGQVYESSK
jgi:hypothetical protein